jgi:hypothetical protein
VVVDGDDAHNTFLTMPHVFTRGWEHHIC